MSMWKRYTLILIIFAIFPAVNSYDGKIKVVVSISDMEAIAKEIGGDYVDVDYILPPGTDPHSFSLTREKIEEIKNADLIILANSNLLSYEKKIKEMYGNCLDFPDYEKNGATLLSFNGYDKNPHGYWLYYKNAIAIAKTIADKLANMTGNKQYFHKNFEKFKERVEEARNCILNESNLNGKKVVASVPGVCYIASNYDIKVTEILMTEGSASISIEKMKEIKDALKDDDCLGIVVPSFMKYAKAGRIALNIAQDTGSRVIYVKFISEGNYEKTFYQNFLQFLEPSKIEEKKYNGELILLCITLIIFAVFEGGIIYALWRR